MSFISRIIRSAPLKRYTPLRKKRSRPRRTLRVVDLRHLDLVRGRRCCVCGAPPPSHPHHVISRKAGGSDRQTAPLCFDHHVGGRGIHKLGPKLFKERYGVDLAEEAAKLDRLRYEQKERT